MNEVSQIDTQALAMQAAKTFDERQRFSLATINASLTIDQVSRGFAEMVDLPGQSMTGRPLDELLWEFAGLENVLISLLAGERHQYLLEHVNRQGDDNSVRYLTFQITPLDEERPADGLLLLVEDTTDYGRLHQDLIQDRNELRLVRQQLTGANEELQQLNRLKSLFLSMAAHDLRGPLTSILSCAELLQGSLHDKKDLELLGIISTQSDRLRRLIVDLLDLDRIEQGKLALKAKECDLNEIVVEVVTALRPRTEMAQQTIIIDLPKQPLLLWADRDRLTQIVYNLVGNAVKYSPEGGQIRVSASRSKKTVVLEVADDGPGMSADQVGRLFSLYYRTKEAREGSIPGTGLGLFIVKSLVEAHQGKVSVQSQPGQGTTFAVRLPANQ